MIGRKLAHYTITSKIGEGGMGVVYEARDSHLDRAVALKLLPHDALANPARKLRFVQEAKTASALNHPHIVTIYDINAADGTDYIAMELIRGRTLQQALSRGKLPVGEALKYGVQIADALAAAHAAGIVHRDLKPGNVMITERGDIKVLDFGLAKLTDAADTSGEDETQTQQAVTDEGSVVGSAPYMSPEQAQGRKVDARSDIFSFGSVMYEMLTGKRAFRGANRTATMAAILKEEPEPPSKLTPDLPREVERVVTRCLRKDLDRRSQSMAEIRVELQDLKEESESGSLSAPAAAAPDARRRGRWPYYAAGVLLALAAIAALWFLGPGRPAPLLHASVLTSFIGNQFAPSLSPDGNQFAFAWDGDIPHGPPHVYISLVGKGTPLRLTPENEFGVNPAWSPDGQSIAFFRGQPRSPDWELHVMPALGGPSRKIASAKTSGVLSWSPDGKWLLWKEYLEQQRTYLRVAPASGGGARNLLDEPPGAFGDRDPSLSPDGRQLVFSRNTATFDGDLYLADFQDGRLTGKPRQLTHDHTTKWNPLWTNDGKEIIYIAGEFYSGLSLYRVRASGGEPQRIEGIGTNANYLTMARKGDRLIYATQSVNYDIHRLDLTAADAKPERFLSSTRYEGSPSYSPDGKRIAFTSNRAGVRQIWVADADGSNPTPLTSFAGGVAGSPKWSPDGQFIVFDARPGVKADIYTVPSAGGPVKRLTNSLGEDHVPSWSPDGKWIYFGSDRTSTSDVYRMNPDGSGVQQKTHNGGVYGQISPDGKWLYYTVPGKGVWKMPPEGGEATQVLPPSALNTPLNFTLTARGIYVIGMRQPEGFPAVFYPFDGGKPRTIATFNRAVQNFPAVSPDDRWFLFSNADDPVYEIMLVDKFR
jgi:Tol biopolymer transport system component/tRNA A-37 threonylcarbamoyl transferase component Bud32